MKTLVTGGAGWVGGQIARWCARKGHIVDVFDEVDGSHDVCNPIRVMRATQDMNTVYHIAGLLGTAELLTENVRATIVNVLGTLNVLNAARRSNSMVFFFPTKQTEWLDTYSITKRAAQEFVQMYHAEFGVHVKILRWMNIYGPGQKLLPVRKAVPLMIVQALYDEPIEIYGDGEQFVDLEYIDDVVDITVKYVEHGPSDPTIRDCGCAWRMSVNEMAERIKDATNSRSVITHIPMRPGEGEKWLIQPFETPTAVRVLDLYGCETSITPFEKGLERTIAYYDGLDKRVQREALEYHKS